MDQCPSYSIIHSLLPFRLQYKFIHIMPGMPPVWEYSPNREYTVTASGEDVGVAGAVLETMWCDPAAVVAPDSSFSSAAFIAAPVFKEAPEAVDEVEAAIQVKAVVQASSPVAAEAVMEAASTSSIEMTAEFTSSSELEGGEDEDEEVDGASVIETVVPLESDEISTKPANGLFKVRQSDFFCFCFISLVCTFMAVLLERCFLNAIIVKLPIDYSAFVIFQGAAKTAGFVAMGVAAGAVLSALAIDASIVADVAMIGAVAAAAAGTSSAAKSGGSSGDEEGAVKGNGDEANKVSSEPGVVMAAGLMGAIDAGKSVMKAFGESRPSAAAVEEEVEEEEEEDA
jgi:hypothetical protein